eukprot:scaffold10231_cov81-Isochrysis_galbana.AAC.3
MGRGAVALPVKGSPDRRAPARRLFSPTHPLQLRSSMRQGITRPHVRRPPPPARGGSRRGARRRHAPLPHHRHPARGRVLRLCARLEEEHIGSGAPAARLLALSGQGLPGAGGRRVPRLRWKA